MFHFSKAQKMEFFATGIVESRKDRRKKYIGLARRLADWTLNSQYGPIYAFQEDERWFIYFIFNGNNMLKVTSDIRKLFRQPEMLSLVERKFKKIVLNSDAPESLKAFVAGL